MSPAVKITAPDHEYPSYLQLRLTVTDSTGLATSTILKLQPKTALLRFESVPPGLGVAVGPISQAAPFELRVIDGSLHSVSVPVTQTLNGTSYGFLGWSDHGAASHEVRATGAPVTYTASFAQVTSHRPNIIRLPRRFRRQAVSAILSHRSRINTAAIAAVLAGLAARLARRRRRSQVS